METQKHTPGDWHRNIKPASKYPTIFAGRNKHVCVLCTKGLTEEEIEGNADLIKAAPAMLAALTELLAAMRLEMPPFESGSDAQFQWASRRTNAQTKADAAIARATGQKN